MMPVSSADKTRARRAKRNIALWLYAGFLALNVAMTRGHFYLSDEVEVFQQARSLWDGGNLSVAPNVNTVRGRNGLYYAPYGIGQSILALPFYAAGKTAHRFLEKHHAASWIKTLAGPPIGDPDRRWGGEVEIFFVNLFCAFVMPALMVLFFWFNLRLGVPPLWSVVATLLLGLTTHLAGFGVEFLQHPAEALLLLLAFYYLFEERSRLLAGLCAAMLILVRASGIILIPALTGYLLWNAFYRSAAKETATRALEAIGKSAAFLIPIIGSIMITMLVNGAKWGKLSFSGSYGAFNTFDNSWLVSLYGFLFSPGQSIFLFSPLLLLAFFYFRPFAKKYPFETAAIFTLAASYTLFYGKSLTWHGQWCFGPRYLVALVPLLMLPFGMWLERARPAAWFAILPLAMVGGFIEVLHVAINVSYVIYREGYDRLVPKDAYIFVPQVSQIAAHWRALVAFDDRVDLWLINVARDVGLWRALALFTPLAAVMALSIIRIKANLAETRAIPMRLKSLE
jgi:MFS family permease